MAVQEQLMTVDEFWALCQQPEYQDKQLELINGRLVVMAPSGMKNSNLGMRIGIRLGVFIENNKLGSVTGADGGYILSEGTVRAPDVGFIRAERIPEGEFAFFPGAPDLAVEVISPSESAAGITAKTQEYLEAGTQLVWNVFPKEEVVHVVTLGAEGALITQVLSGEDVLSGGEVLPGFELPVAEIFGS